MERPAGPRRALPRAVGFRVDLSGASLYVIVTMTNWKPKLDPDRPLYVAIVDALAEDIASGRLPRGARLPTHRELARTLGVSIGTITRAFNTAEQRGLVSGITGRGTFVGGGTSAEFGSAGVDQGLIDLSRTWPLYSLDPDMAPALGEIARNPDRHELLRYHDNAGMPAHRAAGADWALRCGVETSPEAVVICSGVQHAILVALAAAADPGDWVLTEEFTYPGFHAAAHFLHLRVHGLRLDERGLVPDAFEAACRQRRPKALYCTPTLQNPTTATLPAERRERIVEIAREHDVAIIEDDVHRLLATDPPPPLATLAPERSYFIAGMSKSVTGALRVAYLVPPADQVRRASASVWATTWMVPPLVAELASRWIEDGTADATVQRKRHESAERLTLATQMLSGLRLHSAMAAYHTWLELPEPWTSAAFTGEARRRGVEVTPMEAFATSTESRIQAVRVCLSAPRNQESLRTGLERLLDVLDEAPGPGPAIV